MSGVSLTLQALHHGERGLERDLLSAAERHTAEHEIHHIATDLARWSREHARRLAETGSDYGLDLADTADHESAASLSGMRDRAAEVFGHQPEPGLLVLRDLRELYLAASGNSLLWEMLAQVAQATRDGRLLELASSCHPQTLRQIRWTNTMIKNLSPQILSSLT
ncbi:MAG: hypothetical protein WCA46_06760 [Actinocatenispora sp.]